MSAKHPMLLVGMFLLLVSGAGLAALPKPLPGTSSISSLVVKQDETGTWKVDFDYFNTGALPASLSVELLPQYPTPTVNGIPMRLSLDLPLAAPWGAHHISVDIRHPGAEMRTLEVAARLRGSPPTNQIIAEQKVEKSIAWPNPGVYYMRRQAAAIPPEQRLAKAVALIDSAQSANLREARIILEQLIQKDPKLEAAYIELARIAMGSNWGPEGLHQAEALLSTALQIKPDSVNAKILLGYVYAHQQKFEAAQKLLAEAATSNPRNLWLWTNWGELLAMQGKPDEAIVKFREAITRPMTHDTYDRARSESYRRLLIILEERRDFADMETLYRQRLTEFGPGSCYSADYARFMLQVRGDTEKAIALARGALDQDCEDSESRQILGLASYVKWAATPGPERAESLNQARIYLPAGPMPLFLLSSSDRTLGAARELIAAGEPVDQRDNDRQTALAYALHKQNLDAAKRLLAFGADPSTPVGYEEMPVALIPIMEDDLEAVRMLQKAGVDYSKLRFEGMTALDLAKASGSEELVALLGHHKIAL